MVCFVCSDFVLTVFNSSDVSVNLCSVDIQWFSGAPVWRAGHFLEKRKKGRTTFREQQGIKKKKKSHHFLTMFAFGYDCVDGLMISFDYPKN